MPSIAKSAAWKRLTRHQAQLRREFSREHPGSDARRVKAFSLQLPGLHADYSRNLVDAGTMKLLVKLAETAGLAEQRKHLFGGGLVNNTEGRAALHTLLRAAPDDVPKHLAAQAAEVQVVFQRMREFTDTVHAARRITDVVHIGIGGSHLGPELVVEALTPLTGPRLRMHFISNVDPMHAARVLGSLDPARTLVVIVSKTFTTQETLANAGIARAWLVK